MLSMLSFGENALDAALLIPPIAAIPPITPAPIKRLRRVRRTSGAKADPEVVEAAEAVPLDCFPWLPKELLLVLCTGRTRENDEVPPCRAWALLVALPLRFVGRALVAGVLLTRFCGTMLVSSDSHCLAHQLIERRSDSSAQRYCDI